MTANARGGRRRAALRRRRKLFPVRKLPGSAAADGLPSPLRERGGAPSPGGGPAGREGAGRGEDGQIGARGAQAPALWGARGRSPAALSPRPRTQLRRRRHERARPGVAVPNLPPPFAAAAHRVLCVSLAALGSLRRSPDSWWARHGGSRVFPAAASGARPGQRRRTEEERWQILSWSGRRRGEPRTALRAAGDQPRPRSSSSRPLPRRDPPVLPPGLPSQPAPGRRPAPCSAAERARSRILGNPPRPLAPAPSNDLGLQGEVPSNQVSENPASPRECSQWNTTPATHPPWSTRNKPLWALRCDPDPGAQSKSSPAGAVSQSEPLSRQVWCLNYCIIL